MKAVWSPGMTLPPHNHLMWAVIGVYGGTEENRFFGRADGGLAASGGASIATGRGHRPRPRRDPRRREPAHAPLTGAIHVYGGDFLREPRSVWPGEPPVEQPATGETMRAYFDQANERPPRTEPRR